MFLSPGSRARPNRELTRSSNTWTGSQVVAGTQTVTGNGYFKSGYPWTDVKAWGAKGNSVTADDTAIQNAINYMNTTYGGGVVYVPPGTYVLKTGLTISGAVRLVGAGRIATTLTGFNSSTTTPITFGSAAVRGCAVEHMTVLGFFSSNAASVGVNTIVVNQNISAIINDVTAWYGSAGLFTQGIDGYYHNSWFNGCQDCVVSNGANWYERAILDGNGSFSSYRYAFFQGLAFSSLATSQENSFTNCDFSGNFTASIHLAGGGAAAQVLTKISNSVMSAPIDIQTANWTGFANSEFGSSVFTMTSSGGTASVVGCWGEIAVTLSPSSQWLKAANFQIS